MREAKLMKKKYGVLLVDEGTRIGVYFIKGQSKIPLTKVTEDWNDGFFETFTKPTFSRVVSKEVTL